MKERVFKNEASSVANATERLKTKAESPRPCKVLFIQSQTRFSKFLALRRVVLCPFSKCRLCRILHTSAYVTDLKLHLATREAKIDVHQNWGLLSFERRKKGQYLVASRLCCGSRMRVREALRFSTRKGRF